MTRTTMDHETTISSLAGLYRLFTENKDTENSAKIRQLIEKAEAKEVQLAFCGHFSAGKSTMINHLVGQKILPSSPIPTSAAPSSTSVEPSAGQSTCATGTA